MSGGVGYPKTRERLGPDAPLIAGRIHGVRTWSVAWTSNGDLALAGYGGCEWEAGGRPTRAECASGGSARGHAPAPDCGCGLYARHPFADEAGQLSFGPPRSSADLEVAGIVEAWGRVELHAAGFRAEHARPIALVVHGEWRGSDYAALVGRLAERYAAEVLSVREPAELAALCGRRKLGLAASTVRSLLRERQRPEGSRLKQVSDMTPPRTRRGGLAGLWQDLRPDGLVDALALLAGGALSLLYLAFWAGIAYVIAGAIFGWFPDEDGPRRDHRGVLHGKRSLEILDEELVREGKRRLLYLARVKNTGDRTAVGVVPSGRLLGRDGEPVESIDRPVAVQGEANLAPGESGVVWDVIRTRGEKRVPASAIARMDVFAGARRLVDGPTRPPVVVRDVRSDRELCIVTATVDSRRRIGRARLAVVGRDPKGRVLGAGKLQIGPLSPGRDEYFVTRIPPRECGDRGVRLDAHASLTRRQLLGRSG